MNDMKYINLDDPYRMIARPETINETIKLWFYYFTNLVGRENLNGKREWVFMFKNKGEFIKTLKSNPHENF